MFLAGMVMSLFLMLWIKVFEILYGEHLFLFMHFYVLISWNFLMSCFAERTIKVTNSSFFLNAQRAKVFIIFNLKLPPYCFKFDSYASEIISKLYNCILHRGRKVRRYLQF